MKNKYALTSEQTITAPNGTKITIYTDGDKRFVKVAALAKALGYTKLGGMNGKLGLIFKNHQFPIFQKSCGRTAEYMTHIDCVIPILQAFIRFTLVVKPKNPKFVIMQDDARMEAERLIELFNTEVFGKSSSVTVTKINAPTGDDNNEAQNTITENKPIATIEDVPPYGKTIGIYVRNGETFILVDALGAALYGYCDDTIDFDDEAVDVHAFETVLKAAELSGVPETDTDQGEINTRNVLGTLDKFYEVEPRESIADNAISVKDFLREYEYFQPPAPVNDEQEDTQMQDSATNQATVPTVTVADIEDIGERTEAVMKIFGVSKVDALRAVTQLKAQEINRELQPLLELLDGQKK